MYIFVYMHVVPLSRQRSGACISANFQNVTVLQWTVYIVFYLKIFFLENKALRT